MRHWQRDLRKASYRGVRFWVEYEDLAAGKRIARHEYAGGRHTFLEEMGLKTSGYSITAYLLGDTSDIAAGALAAACLASGPGRLVLPIDGGFMAVIEDFQRSRERDRQGYIAFTFNAIPLSNEAGVVLGLGDVTAAFVQSLDDAVSGFAGIFE